MKNLEVEDSEQVHAAFLVYMDLKEGEFKNIRDWCEHRRFGQPGVSSI